MWFGEALTRFFFQMLFGPCFLWARRIFCYVIAFCWNMQMSHPFLFKSMKNKDFFSPSTSERDSVTGGAFFIERTKNFLELIWGEGVCARTEKPAFHINTIHNNKPCLFPVRLTREVSWTAANNTAPHFHTQMQNIRLLIWFLKKHTRCPLFNHRH